MNNAAWLDETKSFRERAEALVGEMTLEEKVFQTLFSAPAIERLGVPAYNYWNEALHGVARAGVATVFPQAIGLAAIFDGDFHQRVAECISVEARAKYNAASSHGDRAMTFRGASFFITCASPSASPAPAESPISTSGFFSRTKPSSTS